MLAFGASAGREVGWLVLLVPYGVTWLLVGAVAGLRGFPPSVATVDAAGRTVR